MQEIKMVLFDIDGVITDGKKYIDGNGAELKSVCLKDLDAIGMFKEAGYKIGCITGEDTPFCRQFSKNDLFDYVRTGCREKGRAVEEAGARHGIALNEICYIGDGKYDISALKKAGLAVCPEDAADEARREAGIVLKRKGGEGCIAELYSLLARTQTGQLESAVGMMRITEHRDVLNDMAGDSRYMEGVEKAAGMIIESYRHGGQLFLCGNGGSAADAQHIAAELVGRFYMERKALAAEALTANTSVLTSLANDYDYQMVFARQVEAKAHSRDILIGITTSGASKNILQAFQKAEEIGLGTILMTGCVQGHVPVLEYTDCLLSVPSRNTPRIQEMHILTGHIICEMVEKALFS